MLHWIISFAVIFTVMWFVKKSLHGDNKLNEKKSIYYSLSAEKAEKRHEIDKWVFRYTPLVLLPLMLISLPIIFILAPVEVFIVIRLVILAVNVVLIVFVLIGLFKSKNINVVIERDCDIIKGRRIMEIRLNEMPSRYITTAKAKSIYNAEIAHCYALSEDEDWAYKTVNELKSIDAKYPKAIDTASHINVRLKLAARQGNLEDIDACIRKLNSINNKPLKNFNPTCLIEEAQIHRYMVTKEYNQAREMINQHFKHGDCILAFVYMHYYLAIIALSEGNETELKAHMDYVANNGGNTYYLNDLRNRIATANL